MPTIRLDNVSKLYRLGEFEHWAVQGIDLTVEQGDFLFLVGSRGAGKSTLLNIMAGLMKPNLGRVFLDDTDVNELKPKDREKAFETIRCIEQGAELDRSETVYGNLSEEVRQLFFFRRRVVNKPLVDKALGVVGRSRVTCRRRNAAASSSPKQSSIPRRSYSSTISPTIWTRTPYGICSICSTN